MTLKIIKIVIKNATIIPLKKHESDFKVILIVKANIDNIINTVPINII